MFESLLGAILMIVSEVSQSIRGRKLSVLGASSGAQIGHFGCKLEAGWWKNVWKFGIERKRRR